MKKLIKGLITLIILIGRHLTAPAQIAIGVFFLMNSVTDIQLGFGCVLVLQGLHNLFRK